MGRAEYSTRRGADAGRGSEQEDPWAARRGSRRMPSREGALMSFMQDVYDKVKGRGARVVYPDALEERAIRAARWLADRQLVIPVLIGPMGAVRAKAESLGVALDGIELRDPAGDPRRAAFEAEYLELRKHK